MLVEGISVRAFLIFPLQANGRNIKSVEGLAQACELSRELIELATRSRGG